MIKYSLQPMAAAVLAGAALIMTGLRVEAQTVLFADSFDRANDFNIDATTNGMSGIDAPMTYWESDVLPTPNNEAMTQVTNNSLYLAYGNNMSVVALQSHNFIDSQILTDGGFRISMDMTKLPSSQTAVDNYCGFGVGISINELANLNLDYNNTTGPRGRFNNASYPGVADFYTCWTLNGGGDVQIFFQGAALNNFQYDMNVGTAAGVAHTLRADFYPAGFNAGDNVVVFVYIDDSLVVSTNFAWHDANANYLAVSARLDIGFAVDNLKVETISLADAQLVWTGDGSANAWNASSVNWMNSVLGVSSKFANGKNVTFDDTSVNTNVNVSETVSPALITLNNTANNYAFSGSGSIAGTGSLTKLGSGTATFSMANSFLGGATISGGTLEMDNDGALGAGPINLGGGILAAGGDRTITNTVVLQAASQVSVTNGNFTFAGPIAPDPGDFDLHVMGGGTVRITDSLNNIGQGGLDIHASRVVIDGATATNVDDGIRLYSVGATAELDITNNGIYAVGTATGTPNVRLGHVASDPGTSLLRLSSGALELGPTAVGLLVGAANYTTGMVYQTGGTIQWFDNAKTTAGVKLGNGTGAYGEYHMDGGSLVTPTIAGSSSGTGIFYANGGTIQVATNSQLSTFISTVSFVLETGGAVIDNGGFDATVTSVISGSGPLTTRGAGSLILTSANTYTGDTTISAGTLALSGSGSLASPNISVAPGATFDVSGVTGGSYALNSSGTLTLNATKAGSTLTSGQVAGSSVTADGTLNVNVGGDDLADGDTFTLFNVTPGGAFSTVNLPAILPATGTNWFTGNNYQTLTYNVWPTATGATVSHSPGASVKIPITDLVSGAIAGKTITVTGTPNVSGATLQSVGNYVLYTPGPSDANDSFTYTADDGRGGSTSGTLNVNVDTASVFGQQSPQLHTDGSGNISLKFYGVPGYTYVVERSLDLGSWTPISTNTLTTGNVEINVVDNPGVGAAYYRLKWQN